MIQIVKSILNRCGQHAQALGVSTFSVVCDYLWARFAYGLCSEDCFMNTPGFAMKNCERKHVLSHKRWLYVMSIFNDASYVTILRDKKKTLEHFSTPDNKFLHHAWLCPSERSFDEFKNFVEQYPKILIKPLDDEGGHGIKLYAPSGNLQQDYEALKGYLLEEVVVQHEVMKFNNASVNTIRVYSVMDSSGDVHILKAVLRAGVGASIVDNFHSGGVIYPLNVEGGFIESWGVQRKNSDKILIHPGTNQVMLGYLVPHWKELLNMVKEMAKILPQVRYIGWDMAITPDGVELIEANDTADHALFERIGIERLFYDKIMQYR